jgi:hypothetical protein
MDYKKYSPDWKDVIRPSILARDKYVCKVCGIRHKSMVYKLSKAGYQTCDDFLAEWARAQGKKVFQMILVVAHLDQDKSNNDPLNLLTLCPFHHARYDAKNKTLLRKIKFAPKVIKDTAKPTYDMQYDISHLQDIIKMVRDLTNCTIEKHEADSIYSLTLNFLQNVKD